MFALSRDERTKAALLSLWFFLTVATLWLLKASRITSLIVHLGARETPYVRLAGIGAVAVAVFFYSLATSRLSRVNVVRLTSMTFATVLVAFWIALRIGGEHLATSRAFIWALYILVDVYTVVMIELFWTYASDVVTQTEADKLYGIIGLGGIVGGILGGVLVDLGARVIGINNFLVISAGIVAAMAVLGSVTERVLAPRPRQLLPYDRGDLSSAFDGIHEIKKSRYLLLFVGLVVAYEFAATLIDFGVNVVFERAHLTETALAAMYGRLAWIAGCVGIVAQLTLVPVLLRSKRVALLIPPLALLASVVGVVIFPVIATALVMASVGRGLDYSVHRTTRESLYVSLNDAQKYKAKAFIDMFVDRAAKAGASLLLLVLIVCGGSPRLTLLVSCGAMVAWMVAAKMIGTYVSAPTSRSIVVDLLRPGAYPATFGVSNVTLRETHVSHVFLADKDVFKIKKPIDLGFLDYRTIEQRKAACDAAVELNARLAEGVYHGVVPIRSTSTGHSVDGDDGPIVDWAVHMQRLDDEERADVRLAKGTLTPVDIDRIAKHIAHFHAHCRADAETARHGSIEAIVHNVAENFAQTQRTLLRHVSGRDARAVTRYQSTFLREHVADFIRRAANGCVRDGHGDMRLEHIYLHEGAVTLIDCVELNDRFRFADVCTDLAFLSMDLAAHGHVELGERLLSSYAHESGDYDLYTVVDFYESYRAFVRGKISAMTAADPSVSRDTRCHAAEDARRYFMLAVSASRRELVAPVIFAVANGTSEVAERIRDALAAPIIDAAHAEALSQVRAVVESRRSVILDMTSSGSMNEATKRLASELGVLHVVVDATQPIEATISRLRERFDVWPMTG
jgi:aminoglycoside phosphotransferase family enzyme/ATP/ADP translocase